MTLTASDFSRISRDFGIVGMGSVIMTDGYKSDFAMAMDAQPTIVSAPNAAVPALFTTFVDPEIVRIIQQPVRAAEIYGEAKKGSWTDDSLLFQTVEPTGFVSSYGDYNDNGRTGVNTNYPTRQPYHFQTITEYGDRELERAGAARLALVSELDRSSLEVLNRFQNESYFFGISGLRNYGALNDPSLPAAITPTVKIAGGTEWENATALEIYNDFMKQFGQLQTQTGYNVNNRTPMTWVIPSNRSKYLGKINEFNLKVREALLAEFPNLTIEDAPQLNGTGTTITQLFANTINGQKTVFGSFTEKLRSHGPVRALSSWKQKKSQGTNGAIWRYPFAVATMTGV